MTTFVLKKYAEVKPEVTDEGKSSEEEAPKKELAKELTVQVTGSISQIVATALNKVLSNKQVEVTEEEDSDSKVKAISTEDINADPVAALNSASKADVLLISSNGFSTAKEEWFLTNITEKVGKVFYSVESFVEYIASEFSDV